MTKADQLVLNVLQIQLDLLEEAMEMIKDPDSIDPDRATELIEQYRKFEEAMP